MQLADEKIILILLIVLFFSLLIQVFYYLVVYVRLPLYKSVTGSHDSKPVSVIVCAKNELANLQKYLPQYLQQDYPDYEVVVVDDCSWDDTAPYLESMQKDHNKLRVVTLKEQERYRHGKKFALTLGIKAARHEYLLLADADCMPAGSNWLSSMQGQFSERTDIVLGYGPFRREKGLLNRLIRFDAFFIALQYLSFALFALPYMGVGRNLAYRKSLFFKVKGFARHNHVVSGDDDLFVNENAHAGNTRIEIEPASFTYSEAKRTFGDWYRQKLRHTSTAKYYKAKHQWMLFLQPFFNILFYSALIGLLAIGFNWKILAGVYGVTLLLKGSILIPSARRLQEKDVVWLFPVFEPLLLTVNSSFFIANLFRKQKLWK